MASARDNFPEFKPAPQMGTPEFQSHNIEAIGSMLWTCLFLSHASTTFSASYGQGLEAWWTSILCIIPSLLAGYPGAREQRPGSIRAIITFSIYGLVPAIVVLAGGATLYARTLSAVLIIVPLFASLLPSALSATGSVSAWGSLTAALVTVNTFTILAPMPRAVGFTFRGHLSDIFVAFVFALLSVVVGLAAAFFTKFARYEAPRRVHPARELAVCAGLYLNALCEEVMYRGVVLNLVMEWLPDQSNLALLVASIIFGFAHLPKEKHGFRPPNWRYAVTTTCYGVVCGMAWQRTQRVAASAFVHASFNYAIRALLKKESVE